MSKIQEHWIKIEDRSRWLINKVETINPADEHRYIEYWSNQKKRCIEGYWNKDFNKWRYMPASLYYYCNFYVIVDTDKRTKTRIKIRPLLRDIEWEMSYMFLTAKGFSGFEDDDNFTCEHLVKNYQVEGIPKNCPQRLLRPDGKLKTFKEPLQYLRNLHKKDLGKPLYWNNAKNVMILGSRGKLHHCPV